MQDRKEDPPRKIRTKTLLESALYLSTSPSSVRRLVELGELVPSRITSRLLFDVKDLDDLIERGKAPGRKSLTRSQLSSDLSNLTEK